MDIRRIISNSSAIPYNPRYMVLQLHVEKILKYSKIVTKKSPLFLLAAQYRIKNSLFLNMQPQLHDNL